MAIISVIKKNITNHTRLGTQQSSQKKRMESHEFNNFATHTDIVLHLPTNLTFRQVTIKNLTLIQLPAEFSFTIIRI